MVFYKGNTFLPYYHVLPYYPVFMRKKNMKDWCKDPIPSSNQKGVKFRFSNLEWRCYVWGGVIRHYKASSNTKKTNQLKVSLFFAFESALVLSSGSRGEIGSTVTSKQEGSRFDPQLDQGFYCLHVLPRFSHTLLVGWHVTCQLPMGVNGYLSVWALRIDWWPVHGVPHPLPTVTWDWL